MSYGQEAVNHCARGPASPQSYSGIMVIAECVEVQELCSRARTHTRARAHMHVPTQKDMRVHEYNTHMFALRIDAHFKKDGGLVMEGRQFRELVEQIPADNGHESEAFKDITERLQVLARSSPEDKQTLAQLLQGLRQPPALGPTSHSCSVLQLQSQVRGLVLTQKRYRTIVRVTQPQPRICDGEPRLSCPSDRCRLTSTRRRLRSNHPFFLYNRRLASNRRWWPSN